MRSSCMAQRSEDCIIQSSVTNKTCKPERNIRGFLSIFESNLREMLLFSTSLILLLFNLLEGKTNGQTCTPIDETGHSK